MMVICPMPHGKGIFTDDFSRLRMIQPLLDTNYDTSYLLVINIISISEFQYIHIIWQNISISDTSFLL